MIRFRPHFTIVRSSLTTLALRKQLSSSSPRDKLVIFDKDGTLLSFDKPWLAWCTRLRTQMTDRTAGLIHRDITNLLLGMGVDLHNHKIGLGPFAEKSFVELQDEIMEVYHSSLEKITKDEAWLPGIISSCREKEDAKFPLTDVPRLFKQMRDDGYSIAIATADTEDGVDEFLECVKADVDFVMSSSNTEFPPKPSRESADKLCRHFGVDPKNVVMVGDTPTDIGFGLNGRFGVVVGVTTGVGDEATLRGCGAHVILSDLSELPALLRGDRDHTQSVG